MNSKTEKTFTASNIDPADLTEIPGAAIHKFMVSATGYLDDSTGVLMFVGESGAAVARFMYYIGEERNHDVVGVGPGIVAYQLDDDRVEFLRAHVPAK